MKNFVKCAAVFTLAVTTSAVTAADDSGKIFVKGNAVTGTNRLYGEPITDYGSPLGTFGFYNIATYNSEGSAPNIIDRNTPDDAIIATGVDPGFLTIAGIPLSMIDESLNNLPLTQVATSINRTGDRASVPSTMDVDALQPNQATPGEDVTLKQWLSAKGSATVQCKEDYSMIWMRVKNLLPNRLYSAWGLFQTAEGKFAPVPFGGMPNVIATDGRGGAFFKRKLGFCPFENTESGARLLAVDIVYHSDHQIYAQVPDPGFGLFTGTVTHTHMEFRFSGTSLIDEGGED